MDSFFPPSSSPGRPLAGSRGSSTSHGSTTATRPLCRTNGGAWKAFLAEPTRPVSPTARRSCPSYTSIRVPSPPMSYVCLYSSWPIVSLPFSACFPRLTANSKTWNKRKVKEIRFFFSVEERVDTERGSNKVLLWYPSSNCLTEPKPNKCRPFLNFFEELK